MNLNQEKLLDLRKRKNKISQMGGPKNIDKEHSRKHGSKMLHASTEATVPKITIIIRNSYAGAQLCMANIPMDFVFAWLIAEITSVGPDTAASIHIRVNVKDKKRKG